jgi:hypothetical protein
MTLCHLSNNISLLILSRPQAQEVQESNKIWSIFSTLAILHLTPKKRWHKQVSPWYPLKDLIRWMSSASYTLIYRDRSQIPIVHSSSSNLCSNSNRCHSRTWVITNLFQTMEGIRPVWWVTTVVISNQAWVWTLTCNNNSIKTIKWWEHTTNSSSSNNLI